MQFPKVFLQTTEKTFLADILTPIGLYLTVKEAFKGEVLLLESSDYHSKEGNLSFLCFCPLLTCFTRGNSLHIKGIVNKEIPFAVGHGEVMQLIEGIMNSISIEGTDSKLSPFQGLFGYTSYDAIPYFETLPFQAAADAIPAIHYSLFRYVLIFDHFKSRLSLIENRHPQESSHIDEIFTQLSQKRNPTTPSFTAVGEEHSSVTDKEFQDLVTKCKAHCQRGDVFQIVPSRPFIQNYEGDAFQVYRTMRSLNPSPYSFYFNYETFSLGGTSPEAQLVIRDRVAEIHPIAGTYRRSGDDETDRSKVKELQNDPKENSEHVMLVDLARSDLAREASHVKVERYKEVQFFSHVIHLVSKVTAKLRPSDSPLNIFAKTFPAGTLSGAPKYKAMQLINQYENYPRSFYAGSIGFWGLNGDISHAIMIRSFLAKENKLLFRAGCGVVIDSVETKEMEEVYHKTAAVRTAIKQASDLKNKLQ